MRRIDEIHLELPYYGARRIAMQLIREGHDVGRLHISTLMRPMSIEALYRKPRTCIPRQASIYPYLLSELHIERANQVWASNISYIPMARGFMYLVAILDIASRWILAFRLCRQKEKKQLIKMQDPKLKRRSPQCSIDPADPFLLSARKFWPNCPNYSWRRLQRRSLAEQSLNLLSREWFRGWIAALKQDCGFEMRVFTDRRPLHSDYSRVTERSYTNRNFSACIRQRRPHQLESTARTSRPELDYHRRLTAQTRRSEFRMSKRRSERLTVYPNHSVTLERGL